MARSTVGITRHPKAILHNLCTHFALPICALLAISGRAAGADFPVTVLDALNGREPSASMSVFGTAGLSVFDTQHSGAEFTLLEPTIITEIGGFVNNCREIVLDVPNCPHAAPFLVEIRPSNGGVPDKDVVIAAYLLTHDADPLLVSYESAHPNLLMGPGKYFALFAPSRVEDAGYVLDSAGSYRPEIVTAGFVNPGVSAGSHRRGMAVRILGSLSSGNTLLPIADAYVRDGVWAATNFGAAPTLQAKKGISPDNTRRSYLKFDIGGVTSVARATLRLYGHLANDSTPEAQTTVYAVSDTSWDERTLTWNTRRDLGAVLGQVMVRETAAQWFEFDVTAFVRTEQQAGRAVVSFALRNVVHSSAYTEFASRESGSVAPQLLIRP